MKTASVGFRNDIQTNSGKITFYRGTPFSRSRARGNPSPCRTKFCQKKLEAVRYAII